MKKLILLFSGVFSITSPMHTPQEQHAAWVQRAKKIYIQYGKSQRTVEIPIADITQIFDIRNALIDEGIVGDNTVYRLSPVLKSSAVLGLGWYIRAWDVRSDIKLGGGNIKDYMHNHNTDTFWINVTRKPIIDDSDDES